MTENAIVDEKVLEVSRALALRRGELGLSLRHLSSMTGLSSAGISRIENGERAPGLRTLIVLSKALGLTVRVSCGEVTVA